MAWVIGLVALSSNPCICLGLTRRCGLISRAWQTVSINSSLIKPYLVAQILANIVVLILFPSIYDVVKRFLQKRSFGINDEEIIRLFFSSLKRATLFPIFR